MRRTLAIVAATAGLSACGGGSTNGEPKATVANDACSAPMTVLEPGTAPRHVLRLDFGTGGQVTVNISMKMNETISGDGQTLHVPVEMTMPMTETIDDVTPSDARVVVVYGKPTMAQGNLSAEQLQTAQAGLATMKGLTIDGRQDTNGHWSEITTTPPAGLDPAIASVVDQMTTSLRDSLSKPLPTEPVGIGARWRMPVCISMMGLREDLDVTTTLVANDGAMLQLRQSTVASGSGSLTASGQTVKVDRITGTEMGSTQQPLDGLIPTGDSTGTIAMRMTATSDSQTVHVTTTTTITMALRRVSP
jgi:hypothetical protein